MTQIEAVKKVGASLSSASKLFCTSAWLAGHSGIFDINQLTSYKNKEFVSELHIKPAIVITKYKVKVPSFKIAFTLESGTPSGFTYLDKSQQLAQTKAVLCIVSSDGGMYTSNSYYTPSDGGTDSSYGVPYLQFSNMEVTVMPNTTVSKMYVVLYNDSNTLVQYQGRNITNLMSGNNIYKLVKARMRNTSDYSSLFNGANYTKTASISDSNGFTENCVWCMMVPLVDDGKSNGDYSVGQNLDSLPTNINSNRETYNYIGTISYNELSSFKPST
jgi:hypothetical protein